MSRRGSRRGDVPPFYVMEVLKAAARRQESHGDRILLCVGQPATPAPAVVLDAARTALATDALGYTEAVGTPALRTVIADHYADAYGIGVDPDEVIVTTGSSGGFLLALLAAFDAGDLVAMTRPGYPAYRNDVLALGCRVLDLDCSATRFQPTVEQLAALPEKPAGVIVASPANPTGTIIDALALERLANWCADHDVLLISDEIYHGISFGRRCRSAWEFNRDALVVGSVSKYHSMTGWRLGWLLAPVNLHRRIELLQGNLAICAPAVSQAAATAAFTPAAAVELNGHVARYADNRELLLRRLPELGITDFAPPDGAFYAYCDVGHLTADSRSWCADLLAATGVALAPGIDFDVTGGHRFVRISFCGTTAELDEGLDRLVDHLGRR